MPEKFHGIANVEIKYRHRHLDLISDMSSRKVLKLGSIIKAIRRFLDDKGFMESALSLNHLWGPQLSISSSRALDMKLYMKISPELYLKRLIVGALRRFMRLENFRNKGWSSHNPEFTMQEWYEAYTDYNYQMTQFGWFRLWLKSLEVTKCFIKARKLTLRRLGDD